MIPRHVERSTEIPPMVPAMHRRTDGSYTEPVGTYLQQLRKAFEPAPKSVARFPRRAFGAFLRFLEENPNDARQLASRLRGVR